MDRNFRCCHAAGAVNPVALRKESVDRNFDVSLNCKGGATVALRKESVDRNNRRPGTVNNAKIVALRKESVDRNTQRRDFKRLGLLSLSARRAWIEIMIHHTKKNQPGSRSPQGERG